MLMCRQQLAEQAGQQGRTVKPELAIVYTIAAHLVAHVLYSHTLHNSHVLQNGCAQCMRVQIRA